MVVVQSVAAWAERYRLDVEAAITHETGINKVSVIQRPRGEIPAAGRKGEN